jgi:hypothetical protein
LQASDPESFFEKNVFIVIDVLQAKVDIMVMPTEEIFIFI